MVTGIYKIADKLGKLYVGSSSNIEKRWKDHIRELNNNKHSNPKLQNAWNKHGADYFTFSVIEIVADKSKLLLQEQKYLNLLFCYYDYNDHYNILRITGNNRLGTKHTPETKAKIAAKSKGRKYTAETRYKMSLIKLGKLPNKMDREVKHV